VLGEFVLGDVNRGWQVSGSPRRTRQAARLALDAADAGRRRALPSAAISKLLSMRTGQGYAEFAVSTFGTDAAVGGPDIGRHFRAGRVAAGAATRPVARTQNPRRPDRSQIGVDFDPVPAASRCLSRS